MIDKNILNWLLEADVSIQYQVNRDLLDKDSPQLKKRITNEGWGAKLLSLKNENGHWGRGFYQPKWISSHYTLLEFKELSIAKNIKEIKDTIKIILKENKELDGGVNPSRTLPISDVCVNGMFLNYASYFEMREEDLKSIIDYILLQQMPDGGFNCNKAFKGAVHSSLNSTLCVIEGINEYRLNGYTYRLEELIKAENESREFILLHRLFKSDKTGETIDAKMLKFTFPVRWRYDILRALDYFRNANVKYDSGMKDALDIVLQKRKKDGTWSNTSKHSGLVHFEMEEPGKPGRWNTLRALRVLKHFDLLKTMEK